MVHADGFVNPILVTGAAGYLGQHVLDVLGTRGVSAACASRRMGEMYDLTFEDRAGWLMGTVEPSVVIHCAAIVPKTPDGYDDERAADQSLLMLESVAMHAECPIVLASSMTAENPTTAYARAKRAAEQYLLRRHLHHAGDVVVRLPGLYGPPRQSGAIYEAEQAIARGEQPVLPEPDWAVAHVRDAAEHLVAVALGEPHTLKQSTAHAVIAQMGASV
jgi:nucleoside-diphosphate-sugar epimerase